MHEGQVSEDEWAEIQPDIHFNSGNPPALPDGRDLAASMAAVDLGGSRNHASQADSRHVDWAHAAQEITGDPFEEARQVAIRRAPVRLEPASEEEEDEPKKVAYVVYEGRDLGVFYNW